MNLLQNNVVRLRAPEPEIWNCSILGKTIPNGGSLGNTLAPYSRYLLKEYIAESHRDIFDLKQLRLMIDLCFYGTDGRHVGFV